MLYSATIDIHGETKESAKQRLRDTLKTLPKNVDKLTVIHGYHNGKVLQETVRKFKHPRIERIIVGLNQGETVYLIKNRL